MSPAILDTAGRLLLESIRDRLGQDGGRLAVRDVALPDLTASGPLGALGHEVVLAVPAGYRAVRFELLAVTNVATYAFDYTADGGSTWDGITCARLDAIGTPTPIVGQTGGTITETYVSSIPAGATHVRLRVSAFTSGTGGTGRVAIAPDVAPLVAIHGAVQLGASASRIGHVTAGLVIYDDSAIAAAQAAGARASGTVRDLTVNTPATGGQVGNGTNAVAGRFRVLASADGPFTVGVEQDAVSTFTANSSNAGETPSVQRGGGTRHHALLEVPVVERYGRAYVVAGASALTTLRVRSLALAL